MELERISVSFLRDIVVRQVRQVQPTVELIDEAGTENMQLEPEEGKNGRHSALESHSIPRRLEICSSVTTYLSVYALQLPRDGERMSESRWEVVEMQAKLPLSSRLRPSSPRTPWHSAHPHYSHGPSRTDSMRGSFWPRIAGLPGPPPWKHLRSFLIWFNSMHYQRLLYLRLGRLGSSFLLV
jgi:hypothetical protein